MERSMKDNDFSAELVKRGEAEQGFNRDFWRKAGHEARFSALWQMVQEADLMRGGNGKQSRLQKSAEVLRKRES